MSPDSISRRRFLRGAGGASLALPILPSLLPRSARAQDTGAAPCFIAMATHHGGLHGASMYPSDRTLSTVGTYAGRDIRAGAIVGELAGGERVVSDVLRASADRFTPSIAGSMSVLRGLDIPWYIAHHTGGHLGNFARNDGNGGDGLTMQSFPTPTIDRVMAWSPSFYPDPSGVVERSVSVGWQTMSFDHASPSGRSGPIQAQYAYASNLALFQRLFRPAEAFGRTSSLLVDRIRGQYTDLRGTAGISADDRRRLDEHVERLFDIERRLTLDVPCDPADPTIDTEALMWTETYFRDPDTQTLMWSLMNDIVVAAMACGLTRVASMLVGDTLSEYAGDWHQDIAHQAYLPGGDAQNTLVAAHQRFFEGIFLDLVEKLQATEMDGGDTLLDRALVSWTQESGQFPHASVGIPVVTAGAAGGAWQTGLYADYRDLDVTYPYGEELEGVDMPTDHPGLGWNQYLGSVLQAMGLTPGEYEDGETGGYGPWLVGADHGDDYDAAEAVLSEPLPIVMA